MPEINTSAPVSPPFHSASQQKESAALGMWIFLATEVLLFGGLFFAYIVYRMANAEAFTEAAKHTLLVMGTANTAILLISSYFVAVAVHRMENGDAKAAGKLLWAAALLGTAFLVVKGFEYAHEIDEGLFPGTSFHIEGDNPMRQQLFFVLYFTMTSLHGVHVAIGALVLAVCGTRALLTKEPATLVNTVDLAGLYWHLVDVIWVFLFPMFYLAGHTS